MTSQILVRSLAGAAAFLSSGLEAAPAHGPIDATSRASIRITLSIARRMGITSPLVAATGQDRPFCVWSSLPLRGYTLSAEPFLPPGPQAPARRNQAVEAVAQPSAAACRQARSAERQLVPAGSADGAVLLILAPH